MSPTGIATEPQGVVGRDAGLILRYVLLRLLWGMIGLFLLSLVIFFATHVLSGDPARAILGPRATPERLAVLNHELGLDRPLVAQYWNWITGVFHGDLGQSAASVIAGNTGADAAVTTVISPRLVNSLLLLLFAGVICIPIAIALACWSASSRGRVVDAVMTPAVIVLSAIPEFVLGVLLVVIFAIELLHWLPAVSTLSAGTSPWQQLDSFVLPALTLALMATPYIYRMTRAMMIEVLDSDYVVAARLRGVEPFRLLVRHALPNALGPTVQTLALTTTYLVGGAVVVESVFNFPGVGTALVSAVGNRDFPVIQAICLGLATLYTLVFIVADLASTALNPKGEWR